MNQSPKGLDSLLLRRWQSRGRIFTRWGFAVFATTLLAYALCSYSQSPPGLKESQIVALTTGNISGLAPSASDAPVVQLTKKWTSVAAELFASSHADVPRETAGVLSEFIYRGANRFVTEGAPKERESEAEQNLRRFVMATIQIAREKSPTYLALEASTVSRAESICPLWPFC
jgi:hypothetical protein